MWSVDEVRLIEPLCASMDAVHLARRTADGTSVVLRLSEAERLRTGNAGGPNIVFVRHLYDALGFDEHRLLGWRLEHKLVQALVIEHYRPGAMPVTRGLARLRASALNGDLRGALQAAFPGGHYAKTALGDSSGGPDGRDRTDDLVAAAEAVPARAVADLTGEETIVQERLPMEREYRVHSFEDRVVPTLSFLRYGGEIVGERDAPNAFVQSVLDAFPPALVSGTTLAWDIARTAEDRFAVIEMNVAGNHRYDNPGFQCSAFFHLRGWARLCVPRLLHDLSGARGMRFEIIADRPAWPEHEFYADIAERYASLRAIAALDQAFSSAGRAGGENS
ncbi:MAG: hypothetical protein QOJ39_2158 [Candidatus Eremiobacteraeota bacterium]|jgi:hypothetical protein|nr:hypothetical protein [Candidatus Eremiobacteraeota bacterium]